jgi:hypothetical protein
MADSRVSADARGAAAEDDACAQQSVLAILLDAHPAHRSIDEVVLELSAMAGPHVEFAARDRASRAIGDLVAAGLVHRHGGFVFVTRAAVRLSRTGALKQRPRTCHVAQRRASGRPRRRVAGAANPHHRPTPVRPPR